MADQWTDSDRARLAERIQQRMKELPIDTDAEVIRRGGPSAMTWRKILRGEGAVATPSYRKVDRALEWEHGSCEAILSVGEPTPLGSDQTPTEKDPLDDERIQRISELIRELNYEFDQVRSSLDNEESRKRHGR